MKKSTSSFQSPKLGKKVINDKLKEIGIDYAARESGFIKRKGKKITPISLVVSLFNCLIRGRDLSFSAWAIEHSNINMETVSKQAIWKRTNTNLIDFLKVLIQNTIQIKLEQQKQNLHEVFKHFNNVYIQDSTSLKLPDTLRNIFPGNRSKGQQKAVAKIQAIYNLTTRCFKRFSVTSFTDNDQKESPNIVTDLREGDLIIRDLGYFVLSVFKSITKEGAYFLSRYKFGTDLYDTNTMKKISLILLTREGSIIDKEVNIGKKEKISVRLVAIKLNPQIAEERRRKAKNDRDKRLNHSKEYMELLGWSIYITNVGEDIWTVDQVQTAYKMRWFIEVIFKSWKSQLKIPEIIPENNMSPEKAQVIIYAFLLFVLLFQIDLFAKLYNMGIKNISLLKLSNFIVLRFDQILVSGVSKKIIEEISYFCSYESRKKRFNFCEKLQMAA